MAIQQTELPTMNRPRIDVLDEVIGEWLEAKRIEKKAKSDSKAALSAATEKMREVADKLETNDHENPCYVYRDGDKEIAVSISSSSKLVSEVLVEGTDAGDGDDDGDDDGAIG